MDTLQLVSEVHDLNPPDDVPLNSFKPIPSMLHHVDKSDLEKYDLERTFSTFDNEERRNHE